MISSSIPMTTPTVPPVPRPLVCFSCSVERSNKYFVKLNINNVYILLSFSYKKFKSINSAITNWDFYIWWKVQFFSIKLTIKWLQIDIPLLSYFKFSKIRSYTFGLEEYISEKKRFNVRPFTEIRCEICQKNG